MPWISISWPAFFQTLYPRRNPDSGFPSSAERTEFLFPVRPPDTHADSGRPLHSITGTFFRVCQTEDLSLSCLHRFCISDIQTDILFVLVFLPDRRSVNRNPRNSRLQHSRCRPGDHLRTDPVKTGGNPDARGLRRFFRFSSLAGQAASSGCDPSGLWSFTGHQPWWPKRR